jgi:glutamyl-Q tRNA(Asp) synthetase
LFGLNHEGSTMLQNQIPPVFRFAPSPNGHLHLGHAYSALLNEKLAAKAKGELLLRIEDVDRQRSRLEFEASIIDDLNWLGIQFAAAPRRQSDHLALYQAALDRLIEGGFAYRSTISRSAVAALARQNINWPQDPDGAWHAPAAERISTVDLQRPHAIRLNLQMALSACDGAVRWNEGGTETSFDAARWGDVVLKSRDGSFAYHLAVVVDDAAQNVTDIVRGRDLFAATAIHRLLQSLLGFAEPNYRHHDLIYDETGEKLAKSKNAPSLKSLRQEGVTPKQIRARLGF